MKPLLIFSKCISVLTLLFLVSETTPLPNKRIIGGKEAFAGQFPGAAAIYVSTGIGTFFCGGVLVHPQWVLTTADCIFSGYRYDITLGTNTLSGTDPNRFVVSTPLHITHQDYNWTTYENNVGLIQFRLPVELSDYIQPINLPTEDIADRVEALTIGWGQTSDAVSGLAPSLNYVDVVTITNEECQVSYEDTIFDTMVCATGGYNEGTCNGDSGGPLIAEINNKQYVVGVSSFISSRGCESPDPSGFTKIYPYLSFINTHVPAE